MPVMETGDAARVLSLYYVLNEAILRSKKSMQTNIY